MEGIDILYDHIGFTGFRKIELVSKIIKGKQGNDKNKVVTDEEIASELKIVGLKKLPTDNSLRFLRECAVKVDACPGALSAIQSLFAQNGRDHLFEDYSNLRIVLNRVKAEDLVWTIEQINCNMRQGKSGKYGQRELQKKDCEVLQYVRTCVRACVRAYVRT